MDQTIFSDDTSLRRKLLISVNPQNTSELRKLTVGHVSCESASHTQVLPALNSPKLKVAPLR